MLGVSQRDSVPVASAKAGNIGAWDAIFQRYQLPLYAYVFELVREEQPSLDIVQETFISAVRHIGRLREDAKFGGWLFGIAHQKCIQLWRKQRKQVEAMEELAGGEMIFEESPSQVLLRKEQEGEFMKLLEQLAPVHRSVLLLFFIEDFSLEEIAGITGTSVGTVKSRLHYAKKALRKLCEAS
jgi:RNA polymerase sigma-70 factor (ECF subfamily)